MNRLYPTFLKVEGKRVLVVGGGNVAAQKVKGLLECGANVTVIGSEISDGIRRLSDEGLLTLVVRKYKPGDVEGFLMVIGATDDPETQKQVFEEARDRNIPVNVADKPELCSFYLGSVFSKGDLKVAVSTNGKSPTAGKVVRDEIASEFSRGFPEIIERIGGIRDDIRKSFPDFETRKHVHEEYVRGEMERLGLGRKTGNPELGTVNGRTASRAGQEVVRAESRSQNRARVFLVGAGPGDPELITVKGLRILRSAEVVVYDALVGEEILAESPASAEMIYVGKRAGTHCAKQNEINEILIAKAREGKTVIRLKGGDPFIFGRGGEEIEALRDAGIEVRVVPGITAGTGVPASLGLPLTHRRDSSSVLFITGHEDPLRRDEIDWGAVGHVGTVVIYMGIRRLGEIVDKLHENGVPETHPVAIIFGGTLEGERVVTGTLDNICARAAGITPELPGLIITGETVRTFLSNPSLKEAGAFILNKQERNSSVGEYRL